MAIKIVEPSVHMLASSIGMISSDPLAEMRNGKIFTGVGLLDRISEVYREFGGSRDRDNSSRITKVIEYAGRTCYEAYKRKNPDTDSTEGYIANIMSQRHFSVLEHSSFTFEIQCSRAATHEIVRHRHLSFSQESQRYVAKEGEMSIIIPPAIVENLSPSGISAFETLSAGGSPGLLEKESFADQVLIDMVDSARYSVKSADNARRALKEAGYGRKQASEAARAYCPNQMATKIIVTGNARSWLEFIDKRDAPGADRELQGIAQMIHLLLCTEAPEIFDNKSAEWSGVAEQKGPKNEK